MSATFSGTGCFIASAASSPNPACLPPALTTPPATLQAAGATPKRFAAAPTSIARVRAPSSRYCCHELWTALEPPVIWMPKPGSLYGSPAGASSPRTLLQSASISSATSIGRPVITPWPKSSRFTITVTVPFGSMRTNAEGCWLGFSTVSAGAACAAAPSAAPNRPSAKPDAAPSLRKARRSTPSRTVVAPARRIIRS